MCALEVFFEVAQNAHKPFIVHTSQFDIRVTGTQFNIRTYPHETVGAPLAEGNIQLEKENQVYRLTAGQQAWLSGEEVKSLHFTAWFRRSMPIQELLEIPEKTQKVKLTLKGRTLIVAKQL